MPLSEDPPFSSGLLLSESLTRNREPSESMAMVAATAMWPTGRARSKKREGWGSRLSAPTHLRPPSMSPTLTVSGAHRQTRLGGSEGHWACIKGFLWQQEALQSPGASHSSVSSSKAQHVFFSPCHPPPKMPSSSLSTQPAHPAHSCLPPPSQGSSSTQGPRRRHPGSRALPLGRQLQRACGNLGGALRR